MVKSAKYLIFAQNTPNFAHEKEISPSCGIIKNNKKAAFCRRQSGHTVILMVGGVSVRPIKLEKAEWRGI